MVVVMVVVGESCGGGDRDGGRNGVGREHER